MLRGLIKRIVKHPIRMLNKIYTNYLYKNMGRRNMYETDHVDNVTGNVLVFAPHVDDETIGIGGTLLKHQEKNHQMYLVYITDGSGATSKLDDKILISQRKKEGEDVGKYFGFKETIFLNQRDGDVDSSEGGFIEEIKKIIESYAPEIIYTPFVLDGHRDHVETTKAVVYACNQIGFKGNLFGYQVNCTILPSLANVVSPMSQEQSQKKESAYEIFKSQYVMGFEAFSLLERRQSELIQNGFRSEVFVKASPQEYGIILDELKDSGFYPEEFKQIASEFNLIPAIRVSRVKKRKYSKNIKNIIG